jgi:aminopeptidase N
MTGTSRRALLRSGVGTLLGAGALGAIAGCGTDAGGVAAAAMRAPDSSLDPYFPGQGTGGLLVNHCELDLRYTYFASRPAGTLSGTATIRILPFADLSGLSLDLASALRVESVRVNGAPAAFSRKIPDKLGITPAAVLPNAEMATLQIAYSGAPQPVTVAGVGAVGWQQAAAPAAPGSAGPLSLPIGAPTWYPCADHPTLKAPYRISVTAPSELSVLANGTLVGKSAARGTTTWTYANDQPMAGYLAEVRIGDFVVDTAKGPKGVQIRNAYPARLAQQAGYDLGRQAEMISVFDTLFGAYPFDVFGTAALDGLPAAGAAAQTLGLLDAALVDGKRSTEDLIAYSLAAQWFGASVSIGTWADIWLTTGFATYGQWLWAERSGAASADSAARAAMARLAALPADLVLADPGAQRILDPRVALRGACFLHALRLVTGDLTFFQLLALWANRGQGGSATTGDFLQAVPGAFTTQDLTDFMNAWAYATALPQLPQS